MLKFYEKFYYGTRDQGQGELPLGFATPYEENAAFEKRKKTVDDWTRNGKPAQYFDNVPMEGFSISGVVSRWRTSNKLFRIDDPRGFQLEISSDNLFRLIDCTTIANGTFMNKLVWGRDGAQNWLWPANSEEYKKYLKGPSDYVHQPGDVINILTGTDIGHHVYVGKFYCHILSKNSHERGSRYFGRSDYKQWYTYDDMGVDPKPFYVYRYFDPNRSDSYKSGRLSFRRSPVKKGTYERANDLAKMVAPTNVVQSEWEHFYSNTAHSWKSVAKMLDSKPKTQPVKMSQDEAKALIESVV